MAFQTFKRRTAAGSLEAIGAPDGVINLRDGEGLVIDTNVLAVDAVNNRVGINVGSPSKALEIDGDIQLTPTVISTAHVTTTGSLRLRCTDALWIGDNDADAVRIGRTNTALAPIYLRSGGEHDLVVSGSKVGIGVESPAVALEIDGDIKLSPTAISTAHITTPGSLTIRAENSMIIGDLGVDSIRVGRTNTALAPIHLRSGGDNDLVVKDSKVGIGTNSPAKSLDINAKGSADGIQLTWDDADGSATDYAAITIEDTNGKLKLATVDSDGAFGHIVMVPDGNVGIGTESPSQTLDVSGDVNVTGSAYLGYFASITGGSGQAGTLQITGGEGIAATIELRADDNDDAGDNWSISAPDSSNSNTLSFQNNIADANVNKVHFAITPNATVTDSLVRAYGNLQVDNRVGIGTSNPGQALDVDGDINLTGGLSFDDGTAVTSIDTDISSVSGSDDTLASAKAIKAYVDAVATAADLDFQGDSGGALSIDLDSETLTIAGTANEIETSGSGNTLTIGLPNDVIIAGNLTVNGTTTTVATDNTVIEDKLIELSNGTTGSPSGDAGIVVERGSSDNAAFVWDESEDRWVAATTSATGASTGNLTLTPTDLNISDLAFTPDGITTSHITTAGSLKVRADNNIHIGDDGADSVHIGRTNTGFAKIHLRSGADNDLVVSNSKVGIGTDAPGTQVQVTGSAPYVTLKNSTAENTEGGAESRIIFEDHADVTLGQLEVSHSGSADDTKGKMILSTHNGTSLTTAVTIDDAQNTTFAADIITASTRDAADASGANAALSVPGGASIAKALYVGTTLSVANDTQFLGDTNTFSSANTTDPLLIIKNTTNDANGARLRFVKDKGAAGAASDVAGLIEFYADDANQDQVLFSEIKSEIRVATNGQEGGKLTFSVASHDGESQPGLIIVDGDAEDEVDVTIGNGSASLVTVPGDLDVDGTANLDVVDIDGAVQIDNTVTVGVDDTGYDVKFFGASASHFMLWDESADELVLAQDSKLSFHDAAGGENIVASSDGHLEINAGTTLDMTAPTVDINATSTVTVDTDTLTLQSSNANDPVLQILNAADDDTAARLKFNKRRGADAQDGDDIGDIQFWSYDDGTPSTQQYASILAEVSDASAGAEGGKLSLRVAEHDGTITTGLLLQDGNADGEIDVTIGAGASSLVTLPGDIDVDGTANLDVVDIDGYVDINPGGSAGAPALRVVSSDADQVGFKVESTNTTAHAVSINCDDSLTTGSALHIDHNDAATSAVTPKTVHFDFDKDGVTGDGVTSAYTLVDLDMTDGATNHANATVQMVGLDLDIISTNAQGALNNYGLLVNVSGGDINMAAQLTGDTANQTAVHIHNDGNNANRYGLSISAGVDTISGNGEIAWLIFQDGNGDTISTVVNSTASPYATFAAPSDERLKQDIAPTKVIGLDVINKLKMSEFRWKKDGDEGRLEEIGFIAQNCEVAYPGMVGEKEGLYGDYDFPVKDVAPATLIPVMVKAIQELSDNNKALLNRIEELESKLS